MMKTQPKVEIKRKKKCISANSELNLYALCKKNCTAVFAKKSFSSFDWTFIKTKLSLSFLAFEGKKRKNRFNFFVETVEPASLS